MKVIDVWAQQPTERFLAEPFFDSLKRWIGEDLKTIPVEATVKAMQKGQVDCALIAAWTGPQGDLISNEEVAEWVATYPEQFAGLVSVDLRDPVQACKTIRYYVQEKGFKGVRIVQWLWELPCSHALYYPVLSTCVELDVPICLQVGLTGPLKSSDSGKPEHIERIALDFPDLKIVCGHVGYPWHQEMIAFATKFPNVYIDTSAYLPKRYPPELVAYMKTNGRAKVMFGTNYPMLTPEACLSQLDALGLSDEVREAFLSGNAERVFRL